MKVVLDTNVFVSAVFFGGHPGRVLAAWRDGVISPYRDVTVVRPRDFIERLHQG